MKDSPETFQLKSHLALDYFRLTLMLGLCVISLGTIVKSRIPETVKPETITGEIQKNEALNLAPHFTYPEQITLASWQFKTSDKAIVEGQRPGQRYTFEKDDLTATITAFHQPYSDGNISRLFVTYMGAKPATVYIHPLEHPETGYFGAFVFENQAYLSACINPKGSSTITEQQFVSNQYGHNLNFWGWLTGQTALTDSSCLWTLISAPIAPSMPPDEIAQTFQYLETAWVEWYHW
jgi:cyanosortase A-associated protein